MEEKGKISRETIQKLVKLLNQSLRIEYNFVIHYPRIAQLVRDEETKKLILGLCNASVHHADVVANIITHLGGKPDWSFDLFPEGMGPSEIFQIQLEKEKQALQLHQNSAALISSASQGNALNDVANEEKAHIMTVNRIIERLK
jgi:bacterioferritin